MGLAQLVSLNCPNCGANVSRGTLRCEYCGVELALAGGELQPRNVASCPKCAKSIGQGAWFCVNCGQVLLSDATRLKELQRKLQFQQQKRRESMPEIVPHLQHEEFIYYMLHEYSLIGEKPIWVVTDRKFVRYRGGDLLELPWSEVVSVGRPADFGSLHLFNVQTFKENVKMKFRSINGSWNTYGNVMAALNDYNANRKNIQAIICSLKL